jgi:hypothetical protein
MPERMAGGRLREARGADGDGELPLDDTLVQMVPAQFSRGAVFVASGRRESPLPTPSSVGSRVLAGKLTWQ